MPLWLSWSDLTLEPHSCPFALLPFLPLLPLLPFLPFLTSSQIEDYNMVSFQPLNIQDEDSISVLLQQIDNAIQFGEDEEPREPNDDASFFDDA